MINYNKTFNLLRGILNEQQGDYQKITNALAAGSYQIGEVNTVLTAAQKTKLSDQVASIEKTLTRVCTLLGITLPEEPEVV